MNLSRTELLKGVAADVRRRILGRRCITRLSHVCVRGAHAPRVPIVAPRRNHAPSTFTTRSVPLTPEPSARRQRQHARARVLPKASGKSGLKTSGLTFNSARALRSNSGRLRLIGLVLLPLIHLTAVAADRQPLYVVLIVMDDLGWADLGCYGSTFHDTPNSNYKPAKDTPP